MNQLTPMIPTSISLVGTTSCGKSTIGNLLMGRYIFPSGVQETTTSIVEVCHTIADCLQSRLVLTNVDDIQQACFLYEKLTLDAEDVEIRNFINQTMTSADAITPHIRIRAAMNIAPKIWHKRAVHHVHRNVLRRKPLLAEIEVTDGFTIRDFPGFQHEQDSHRLHLIEKHLNKDGLIFFIFNAEETDCVKEDKLLNKLFALLYHHGGDWRAIIFILNRKDAFYRDNHPEERLQNAIHNRQLRIKNLIMERWKQIPADSELAVIPLSAGLVLATEMLCWQSDFLNKTDYHHFKDYVYNYGISLLPDEITDKLSRQIDEWSYRQWIKIYTETYKISGFNQLTQSLKKLTTIPLKND